MKEIRIGKSYISRDLLLFFVASALLGVTAAVESTSFTNRLVEDLGFTTLQRTTLEIPRELPGLIVVFVTGALAFLGDIRTSAIGSIIGGVGLYVFGIVPSGYWPVVLSMTVYSMGIHINLPLQGAISMTFAGEGNLGRRLGQIQSVTTVALILSAAVLYVLYSFVNIPFTAAFTIGAVAMALAGVVFFFMSPGPPRKTVRRFVFRKKYSLFYVLSFFNGARKQITITFVTWLLVTIYEQPVPTVVILFFITNVIGVFFRHWMGNLIDRRGERFVLAFEAALLTISCIGFAFAKVLFSAPFALIVVSACYVIDNLFSVGSQMARTTYVRRLSDDNSEVTGTLSLGVSFDHVVSMFIPFFAGLLWEWNDGMGYIYVFLGGALISMVCFFLANKVKVPAPAGAI